MNAYRIEVLECTAKAISHRIAKLKEIAKSFNTPEAGGTKATGTPTRKKKAREASAAAEDEDGSDEASPTKKQCTAKTKKGLTRTEGQIKTECQSESELKLKGEIVIEEG